MDMHKIRPGKWWYGLAALIGASGLVLFAAFLIVRIGGMTSGLTQVLVPGHTSLTLDEPGAYTIFHEHRSVFGGKFYASPMVLSGLECRLVSRSTGEPVALTPSSVNSTYNVGGRQGMAVYDFEVSQPGVYEFTASYPEEREGPETVFAIGRGFMRRMLTTMLGAFAILGAAMVLSAAIAVITYLRRSNAARALAKAGQP